MFNSWPFLIHSIFCANMGYTLGQNLVMSRGNSYRHDHAPLSNPQWSHIRDTSHSRPNKYGQKTKVRQSCLAPTMPCMDCGGRGGGMRHGSHTLCAMYWRQHLVISCRVTCWSGQLCLLHPPLFGTVGQALDALARSASGVGCPLQERLHCHVAPLHWGDGLIVIGDVAKHTSWGKGRCMIFGTRSESGNAVLRSRSSRSHVLHCVSLHQNEGQRTCQHPN